MRRLRRRRRRPPPPPQLVEEDVYLFIVLLRGHSAPFHALVVVEVPLLRATAAFRDVVAGVSRACGANHTVGLQRMPL